MRYHSLNSWTGSDARGVKETAAWCSEDRLLTDAQQRGCDLVEQAGQTSGAGRRQPEPGRLGRVVQRVRVCRGGVVVDNRVDLRLVGDQLQEGAIHRVTS